MKGARGVLTAHEKKGWPILELSVRQIGKDGRKIRGSAAWICYRQREIRRMIPKRVRAHFGLALLLLSTVALAGCVSTAPYVDSLHRFGAAGRAVQSHLRPAADPSVQALYDSFDSAVKEALKAKGE